MPPKAGAKPKQQKKKTTKPQNQPKQRKKWVPKTVVTRKYIPKAKATTRAAASRATQRVKFPAMANLLESREVIDTIINPSLHSHRFSGPGQGVPTALLDLHIVDNVQVPMSSYAGNYTDVKLGTLPIVFFRDPLCSIMMFRPNIGIFSYVANFHTYSGTVATLSPVSPVPANGSKPLVPLYYKPSVGSPTPHGDQLFCGFTGDMEGFVWMDPGLTLVVSRTSATGSADVVRVMHYTGPRSEEEATGGYLTFATSGTSVTFTCSSSNYLHGGYFRVLYTNLSTSVVATVGLTLASTATSDVMAQYSQPRILDHLAQMTSIRVNGCSLLLSNVASNFTKNGTIQAINVDNDTLWWDYLGKDVLVGYAPGDQRFYVDQAWAKGLYTYLAPGDITDLDFQDLTCYDERSLIPRECSFELNRDRYAFMVIDSSIGAAAGLGTPSMSFILNTSFVLEFRTNDPWYEVSTPDMLPTQTLNSMAVVAKMPFFFENPTHVQKLAALCRAAFGQARKNALRIGAGLSAMFPQHADLIGGMAQRFQT